MKNTSNSEQVTSIVERSTENESLLTTFILVRHAEKAKDGSKNPNLIEKGKQRADRLQKMLSSIEGIQAIYTTDYNRTRQTVAPLATVLNLEAQIYAPHDMAILDTIKGKHQGEVILMAGHSNTIPSIVNHLIGEEKYQDLDESDYENLFIVTLTLDGVSKVLNLKF